MVLTCRIAGSVGCCIAIVCRMNEIHVQSVGDGNALKCFRAVAFILTFFAVAFMSVMPQVSNDFWLQVKVGELIAESHAIPRTLLFPFTEAQDLPFNAHEWFSSLLFYWGIQILGESDLPLVLGVAGLILFGLMLNLAYRRSNGNFPWALFLGVVAVGVENQRHYLRPELLSLILLALFLTVLDACRREPRYWKWLMAALIVLVWTNIHGSFILAPIISALYAAGIWGDYLLGVGNGRQSSQRLALGFVGFSVASILIALINPVGYKLLHFVVDFGHSNTTKLMVAEWLPSLDQQWRGNRGFWISVVCLGTTFLGLSLGWRRVGGVELLLFLLFAVLAFSAIRFLVYLGMVAAYVLSPVLANAVRLPQHRIRSYVGVTAFSAFVLFLCIKFGNVLGAHPHVAFEASESLSRPMVAQLQDPTLEGNVLNSYELGAELVYRAYPRLRPSIDSRVDSYGGDWTALNEHLFLDDVLLKRFVANYNVKYMLLTHHDFIALQKLPSWSEKQWVLRALDRRTALLVKGV